MTLASFLLARIAEDEANLPDGFDCWYRPERYAAECQAKRRIVHDLSQFLAGADELGARREHPTFMAGIELQLRYLATVYADHPDYREEWKP